VPVGESGGRASLAGGCIGDSLAKRARSVTVSGGASLPAGKADSGLEFATPSYYPPDFRDVRISLSDS